jgi:Fe-S-cluster containining protein
MFMQREGECNSCGDCCQTVNMTVVRDVTLRQHGNLEELQRYLSFRGIRVVGEDKKNNQLYYSMDIQCSELTPENKCRVHGSPEKPLLCHRFPETKKDIEDIKNCGFRFTPVLPGHPVRG